MIIQERLANSSLNDLFTSFHNFFLPNSMDVTNPDLTDDFKLELGRSWKVAVSYFLDEDSLTRLKFFDFALHLQSVKAVSSHIFIASYLLVSHLSYLF